MIKRALSLLIILTYIYGLAYATPSHTEYMQYLKSKESIWKGPAGKKAIALTFDDGPKPEYCNTLLEILDRYGVKATFFVVGSQAELYPDLIYQMYLSDHEVANHTYSHMPASKMTRGEAVADIQKCSDVIYKIIGTQPKYFRPPGGGYDGSISLRISRMGLKKTFWSLNPSDYVKIDSVLENTEEYKSVANELAELVISKASDGDIILLHNGSEQTLFALPAIIEGLRKKGYGFVTVSQLMEKERTYAGKTNNTLP